MREVPLRTENIELGALLKWARVVSSGGEAKRAIQEGRVRVNGKVERRRGRKIRAGDRVDVGMTSLLMTRAGA